MFCDTQISYLATENHQRLLNYVINSNSMKYLLMKNCVSSWEATSRETNEMPLAQAATSTKHQDIISLSLHIIY